MCEGGFLGTVDKICFNKNLKKLIQLEIIGENGIKLILKSKNIYKIGKNAITIKNNQQMREIDLNKFHIMNGVSDYVTTDKTYGTEFQDYGKTYEGKELKSGEQFNLIMVFRVDKEQSPKRFVLYYQEFNN